MTRFSSIGICLVAVLGSNLVACGDGEVGKEPKPNQGTGGGSKGGDTSKGGAEEGGSESGGTGQGGAATGGAATGGTAAGGAGTGGTATGGIAGGPNAACTASFVLPLNGSTL